KFEFSLRDDDIAGIDAGLAFHVGEECVGRDIDRFVGAVPAEIERRVGGQGRGRHERKKKGCGFHFHVLPAAFWKVVCTLPLRRICCVALSTSNLSALMVPRGPCPVTLCSPWTKPFLRSKCALFVCSS